MKTALCLLAPLVAAAPLHAAGPLEITNDVRVERRVAAPDGATRTEWVPADRAVPGDRMRVTVGYRNTGSAPIADLAITNRVPAGLAYGGAAPGARVPDVSVDGVRFAPLAALAVAGRPAVEGDVTHVRWRLASPLAPGREGRFAFQAVLK